MLIAAIVLYLAIGLIYSILHFIFGIKQDKKNQTDAPIIIHIIIGFIIIFVWLPYVLCPDEK